ncbi:hypothetical protein niasHS_006169 [Heterodera schachtii]|uniref:Uncharacterized protein n=1 Tax=Heterodera schachtii TaxID=97005 RepID=A0ABD2JW74_HETSC
MRFCAPIRPLMKLVMNKLPDCALRPHWGGGLRRGAPKKLDKRRMKTTKNDQNGDAHFRPSVVVILSPVPSGASAFSPLFDHGKHKQSSD